LAHAARRLRQAEGRHIIIIGAGQVGIALARALATNHNVFVIDHDPGAADRFAALDVQFIQGSATSASDLELAKVAEADVLISCTGQDEVNLVACSIARRLGQPETVCFVSKDDFLRSDESGDSLRQQFGIDHVVWPKARLADDIERIIAVPGAVDAETFADGRIRLVEYRLPHDSSLTRAPIADLNLPKGTLIVAVKRRDALVIPHGATRLAGGDKIIVMGLPEAMREAHARVVGAEATTRRLMVTIVGGGDVGFRLAQRLDAQGQVDLRVIEPDQARGELIASTLNRGLVLKGDGTDLELLDAEQIGRSDVLVSVIDNDERNLLASLLGRQLGVGKVITRVSKPANLRLFQRLGIDVALSARGAAVAAVMHTIEGGSSSLLAVLEEGEARVLEVEAPADYTPTALRQLQSPANCIVGAIVRDGEALVPRGNDVIAPGDRLIVFAASSSADQVRDYFAGARR